MRVVEVMSRHVVTTTPASPILSAISDMLAHHVSGLPVVNDHGILVGMVTESDFLERAELGAGGVPNSLWARFEHGRNAMAFVQLNGRLVQDVMTENVLSVGIDADLQEAVAIMRENDVKRVPVLQDGQLCGIVSRRDLMCVVRDSLQHDVPPLADDEIVRRLQALCRTTRWAPHDIDARAQAGKVSLSGVVRDEADISALRVMAQNLPGVKAVDTGGLFLLSPGTGYSRPEDLD